MENLRRHIVLLILEIALFIGIEGTTPVDVSMFVKIIALATIALVIFIPLLWRTNVVFLLSFVGFVYLLTKVVLRIPLFGNEYETIITFVETLFLVLFLRQSRRIARSVSEFEEAIRTIILVDTEQPVFRLEESMRDIQNEITRARRYQNSLTVVSVQPDPETVKSYLSQAVHDVVCKMAGRYVSASIARVIGQQIRGADVLVSRDDPGRFVVICPETDLEGAQVLSGRIQTMLAQNLGVRVSTGTASFPGEGDTFEELLHKADMSLQDLLVASPAALAALKAKEEARKQQHKQHPEQVI